MRQIIDVNNYRIGIWTKRDENKLRKTITPVDSINDGNGFS